MAKKSKSDGGLKSAAPEPVEQAEEPKAINPAQSPSKAEPSTESTTDAAATSKSSEQTEAAEATAKPEEPEVPPPVPRRPPSPFSKSLSELAEAFPDANKDTSRAILVAAAGNLESAFNGMLALTDDSIRPPPPEPPRPNRQQIKSDEQLARELAGQYARRSSRHSRPRPPPQQQQQQQQQQQDPETPHRRSGDYNPRQETYNPRQEYEDYDDRPPATDDFGEFRDNFSRGLSETKDRVSSFWGQLKERFNNEMYDGDDFEDPRRNPPRGQGAFASPRRESRPRESDSLYDEDAPLRPQRPSQENDRDDSLTAAKLATSHAGGTPGAAHTPSTPGSGPNASGPVNAFGEVNPTRMSTLEGSAKKKWEPLSKDELEPDAFFIGESEDDDLGSLDEGKAKADTKKDITNDANKEISKDTAKDPAKEAATEVAKDDLTPSSPSARELLTKFKDPETAETTEAGAKSPKKN